MTKAAAPDGAIPPEVWTSGVAMLDADDVQRLILLLEDDGYFVIEDEDQPDPDDTEDEEPEPGAADGENEAGLEAELEQALTAGSFPHYNEHGILTREREFELANIMFHGKREAILAAAGFDWLAGRIATMRRRPAPARARSPAR